MIGNVTKTTKPRKQIGMPHLTSWTTLMMDAVNSSKIWYPAPSLQGILSQKTGVFIHTNGCISSHMTTHLQCLEFQNTYSYILRSYYRSMTKFTDLVTICQQDLHICTQNVTSQIQLQHTNRNRKYVLQNTRGSSDY